MHDNNQPSLRQKHGAVQCAPADVAADDIIAFVLDRFTPPSPERAFFDFRILAENENWSQFLIAATKAARLQFYLDAIKEMGITIERVGLSAPGLDLEGNGSVVDGIPIKVIVTHFQLK